MATKNPITGDTIQSGKGNPKLFKENLAKIEPSCYKDCAYLKDTMVKCRICGWRNK